jgi:UDP-N-acetylmuramate dehydrogenase
MISKDFNLKPYNTFGLEVVASDFGRFASVDQLRSLLLSSPAKELLVLGGGSNVLFVKDRFNGLVLLNEIKGFELVEDSEDSVLVRSGAGEVWHEFVLKCIALDYYGIENLSLIPGSVGASPMQNIGAYGVEIKDVFEKLEAYHIATGEIHHFDSRQCEFGYRESVFKRKFKNQYIITEVFFRLTKVPALNTKYGVIQEELAKSGIKEPTAKQVSDAVIAIRSSKLPDPKKIGNAGSFFKNPVVDQAVFEKIENRYISVPNYPAGPGKVKLAAGWLIEQLGFKGKRYSNFGVHALQSLVLVNYGGASGKEIFDLSTTIIEAVRKEFEVELEREVNIYS